MPSEGYWTIVCDAQTLSTRRQNDRGNSKLPRLPRISGPELWLPSHLKITAVLEDILPRSPQASLPVPAAVSGTRGEA